MRSALLAGVLLAAPAFAQGDPEPLKVDEKAGTMSFGARIAEFDKYPQLKGAIEYLVTLKGGKEYESIFVAPVDALAFLDGLSKIGLKPGKPGGDDGSGKIQPPEGSKMRIWVELKDGDKVKKDPAESYILDVLSKKAMDPGAWVYSGPKMVFDPVNEKQVPGIVNTKNAVALYHNDATVAVQPTVIAKDSHQFKVNAPVTPKSGTVVRIIIEAVR